MRCYKTKVYLLGLATTAMLYGCGGESTEAKKQGLMIPSPPPPPTNLSISAESRIAGSYAHTLALDSQGQVFAWGDNSMGQIGNNSYTSSFPYPVQVRGMSGIKAVGAGDTHSVALHKDGEIWVWGTNTVGQLGTLSSRSPVKLTSISGVKSIAASELQTVALKNDGTVWAWGQNFNMSSNPQKVPSLSNVKSVATGGYFAMALSENGEVWAWGNNNQGQLGNKSSTSSSIPVKVYGLSNVKAIAAGKSHAMALLNNGRVLAWGSNTEGQLGMPPLAIYNALRPIFVTGLSGIKNIAAGSVNSMAVDTQGKVYGWGSNVYKQLSVQNQSILFTPTLMSGINNADSISVGSSFLKVVQASGSVYTIGYNNQGRLGNNTYINSAYFTQVVDTNRTGALNLGPRP